MANGTDDAHIEAHKTSKKNEEEKYKRKPLWLFIRDTTSYNLRMCIVCVCVYCVWCVVSVYNINYLILKM